MSLAQSHFEKLLAGVLPKSLSLIISVLLLSTLWASAADPLGATPHSDGSTTFRVWAPFVDAVAVKVNGGTAVPLASEDGHPDPANTTWVGTVPGVKAGDKYRYAIQRGGVTREFNDPRTRQLTGFSCPTVLAWRAMTISPNPSSWTRTSVCRRSPSLVSIRW